MLRFLSLLFCISYMQILASQSHASMSTTEFACSSVLRFDKIAWNPF